MKVAGSRIVQIVLVMLILASATFADARRRMVSRGGDIEAQLGIRLSDQLPENPKPGDAFEAFVLDPERLRSYGFNNTAERGQKISVKVIDEDKFVVMGGSESLQFSLNEQGRISPDVAVHPLLPKAAWIQKPSNIPMEERSHIPLQSEVITNEQLQKYLPDPEERQKFGDQILLWRSAEGGSLQAPPTMEEVFRYQFESIRQMKQAMEKSLQKMQTE